MMNDRKKFLKEMRDLALKYDFEPKLNARCNEIIKELSELTLAEEDCEDESENIIKIKKLILKAKEIQEKD